MVPGGGGDEETFEEFTARSVDHLTRLGYLLSGDHERLLRDGLAEVRRAWPGADATRVLVRRFLADPGAGTGPTEELAADLEALRWALAALPPRQRAAVVLRYWAGLPVPEVAAALDCPDRVVVAETEQGLAGVAAAAAQLTATRSDGVGTGERDAATVLADGLRTLADEVPPLGIPLAEMVAAAGAPARRRRLPVLLAVVVLLAAGATAVTLRTEPTGESAGPGPLVISEPGTAEPGRLRPPPYVELGPVVVDDQARKLTRQLRTAFDSVLPGATLMHSVARPPGAGDPARPLEFHTFENNPVLGSYLAQGTVLFREVAAVLVIEVRRRPRSEVSGYAPCPEIELDCTFRQFPDRTRADVVIFTDPGTRAVVHTLSSLRPDGTYFHVTAQALDLGTMPPVGVEDLFRFARVFTY
jgi:hypothetical protein